MLECDIHVPEYSGKKFSEMCPVFKNTKRTILRVRPGHSLIGSMKGEKILLETPLLKHGLEVMQVYQEIQSLQKSVGTLN